jgi:hypothetical protein
MSIDRYTNANLELRLLAQRVERLRGPYQGRNGSTSGSSPTVAEKRIFGVLSVRTPDERKADECVFEVKECLVDVRSPPVAHQQPAIPRYPRRRALYHRYRPNLSLAPFPLLAMRLSMPRRRRTARRGPVRAARRHPRPRSWVHGVQEGGPRGSSLHPQSSVSSFTHILAPPVVPVYTRSAPRVPYAANACS